jgi:hypothetical protein
MHCHVTIEAQTSETREAQTSVPLSSSRGSLPKASHAKKETSAYDEKGAPMMTRPSRLTLDWTRKIASSRCSRTLQADPQGHFKQILEGRGHWMKRIHLTRTTMVHLTRTREMTQQRENLEFSSM